MTDAQGEAAEHVVRGAQELTARLGPAARLLLSTSSLRDPLSLPHSCPGLARVMDISTLPDEIWHRIFTEAKQSPGFVKKENVAMLSSMLACRKFAVRGRLRYS
jgi:hypothetical protein